MKKMEHFEYFDEWYRKWVPCEILFQGKTPLDEWQIEPLNGTKTIWIGPNNLRKSSQSFLPTNSMPLKL